MAAPLLFRDFFGEDAIAFFIGDIGSACKVFDSLPSRRVAPFFEGSEIFLFLVAPRADEGLVDKAIVAAATEGYDVVDFGELVVCKDFWSEGFATVLTFAVLEFAEFIFDNLLSRRSDDVELFEFVDDYLIALGVFVLHPLDSSTIFEVFGEIVSTLDFDLVRGTIFFDDCVNNFASLSDGAFDDGVSELVSLGL